MSSEEVLAYYPTVHKVADKLPLVQNKLEEIGLPSLSLTGPIAVYLHAFSGNDQPPAVIGAILSEVEFIRKFVVRAIFTLMTCEPFTYASPGSADLVFGRRDAPPWERCRCCRQEA